MVYENKNQNTKAQIASTTQGIHDHKKLIAEKETKIRAIENENGVLKERMTELQREIEQMSQHITSKSNNFQQQNKEYESVLKENELLKDKVSFLEKTIGTFQEKLKEKTDEIEKSGEEKKQLNLLVSALSSQKNEMLQMEQKKGSSQRNDKEMETIEFLENENLKLKERIQLMNESDQQVKDFS